MSELTRDGTAEPVLRDQILRCERGQGNVHFPCSADHGQDLLYVMTTHTYFELQYCLYFQHAHFNPIVGVGKERRILIGPWRPAKWQHPLLELP